MATFGPVARRVTRLFRNPIARRLIMLPRGPEPKRHGLITERALVGGVAHLAIYVSDLARSRRFYEKVLHLEHAGTIGPRPHPTRADRKASLSYLRGEGQAPTLVLVHQTDARGRPVPVSDHGLMHVAFELGDGCTAHDAARALRALGVPVAMGPVKHHAGPGGDGGSGGNTAVYAQDPDGHLVELFHGMSPVRTPERAARPAMTGGGLVVARGPA